MNEKNIFSELGFKKCEEKNCIMEKKDINIIASLFDHIFEEVSASEQIYITKALEDEALAISTAEESSLTAEEAHKIQLTDEQSLRIKKYQEDKNLSLEKKYDLLEYENIKNVSDQSTGIGFEHLDIELICNLHHDTSLGLDEYAEKLKITKYHSGQLRKIDTVKIGRFPPYIPPKHIKIKSLLESLFLYYQQKKEIHFIDIIEFGILFYAIHPFQNGNKRVTRLLESALLDFYGYSAQKTLSLSCQFAVDKTGFHHFLLQSLNKKTTIPFVNFSLRKYFHEGLEVSFKVLQDEAKRNLEKNILAFLKKEKKEQFLTALSFFEKNPILKNSDFTKLMKSEKYTHSISQRILKKMIEGKVIKKSENGNYFLYKHAEFLVIYLLIDEKTKGGFIDKK